MQFTDWMDRYSAAATEADRRALEAEGEQLALDRRRALANLIETDPELALRMAVSPSRRQQMPHIITQHLEERPSGRGMFAVMAVTPMPGSSAPLPPIQRFVHYSDRSYRAFAYGRRLNQTTKENVPLHGIAIGDAMALHQSPVRVLEDGETPDPALPVANASGACPVSQQAASSAVAVEVGGTIHFLCRSGHIEAFREQVEGEESISSPVGWTKGPKTLLYVRVNFPDDLSDLISLEEARTGMTNVNEFFVRNSYGATSIRATVTPLLTLPKAKSWYQTNNAQWELLMDSRAVALAAGYDTASFDLDCVRYQSLFGFGGAAYVGAKGCWLQSSSVGIACHEFGHNYGLWHANSWDALGESVIGPGRNIEYGNPFDTMGYTVNGQFNAYNKNVLDWLPAARLLTVVSNGVFRLHSFEPTNQAAGRNYALILRKDDARDYWVEMREENTSNPWLQNGVLVHWSAWNESAGGSQLLDMSPASRAYREQSPLLFGRTFSDPGAGVHITPLWRNGTAPESIDVRVNLGSFVGNQPPSLTLNTSATNAAVDAPITFTAQAADPNGDSLAYWWDFGDGGFGTNAVSVSHHWSATGEYLVRCVVTDMKGGVDSAWRVVRVGNPLTYRVNGRLTANGQPLEGVRVFVPSGQQGYSDRNGNYQIVGLSSGSYSVTPVKPYYLFNPTQRNISIAATSVTGVDFTGQSTTNPNSPPSIQITWPSDSSTFEETSGWIDLYLDIFDDGQITNVTFLANGQLIDRTTNWTSYGRWSNVVAGEYTLQATATDDGGLMATSTEVHVTVTPGPPRLTVRDASIFEGQGGATEMAFVVALTNALGQTVTVDYALTPDTAIAGRDYVPTNGTLTFAPGQSQGLIRVPVLGDTQIEPDETFRVNLYNPVGAQINDFEGIGTIRNDDFQVAIRSDSPALVAESYTPANGAIDPGEGVTLNVALRNVGNTNVSGNITATLLSGGGVTSPGGPQHYGELTAGGAAVVRSFTFTATGATNAPLVATIQLRTGGTSLGTVQLNFRLGPASDFAILNLGTNDANAIEHRDVTGDDRGGIALTRTRVLVSGDAGTGTFGATNLSDGTNLGVIYQGLTGNLRTETAYALGDGGTLLGQSGGTITSLLQLDDFGELTGSRITLSAPIDAPLGSGVFAGFDRVVIHTGTRVYSIALPWGTVSDLGSMSDLPHQFTESWAYWGVAESLGGSLNLVYVRDHTTVVRARVSDGAVSVVSTFAELSDMASFTVSPSRSRWFFHHEGTSQFRSGDETVGSAAATFTFADTNPPIVLTQPVRRTVAEGGVAAFSVAAIGTAPLRHQWRKDGAPLAGETNAMLILSNVQASAAGLYSVRVTNRFGSTLSSNAMLTVLPADRLVGVFDDPMFVDTTSGGISAESDNLQATLDSLGYAAVPFTNLVSLLGQAQALVFPKLENGHLAANLSPSETAALSNYVASGGLMIVHGTEGRSGALLNQVFGFSVVESGIGGEMVYNRTPQVVGTHFTNAPTSITRPYGTSALLTGSLPPGGGSIYEQGGRSAVALLYHGGGKIIFLGWDWFDAAPLGMQDGGWLAVLDAALRERGPLEPRPPRIIAEPASRTVVVGGRTLFRGTAFGPAPLHYQWYKDGATLPGVTNDVLSLSNVTFGHSGLYRVVVGNSFGSTASSNAMLTVISAPPVEDFEILGLLTNGAHIVDHDSLTGDDRGGIALSGDRVLYTGDNSTARFDLDLTGGTALGRIFDGLVSDLRSEKVYSLGDGSIPITSPGGSVSTLLEHDGLTGELNGNSIFLSEPVPANSGNIGLFAGYGRVVIHTGLRVYDILLPSGVVTDLGPAEPLPHASTENWAYWGVAEYVGGVVRLVYVRDYQTIVRTVVPNGPTTEAAVFISLSDMAAFTVSVPLNRWYFHHEGSSQFGGLSETLGYAEAQFQAGPCTNRPPFLVRPLNNVTVVAGGAATFRAEISGCPPLRYQWRRNNVPVPGATNTTLTLNNVQLNAAGLYSVEVSNPYGVAAFGDSILTVLESVPAAYVSSTVGEPWGSPANISAMDRAFGVGTWFHMQFETLDPAMLFVPSLQLIYMDGSYLSANAMETFLSINGPTIEAWVAAGGSLFLNAAPNLGDGMTLGFGVNLVYPDELELAGVAIPSHPIFQGPFLPVGTAWAGNGFAHATIAGADLTALITNSANGRLVLAEKSHGAGHVIFGGMTTDNYHSPQPQAANLRANILSYAATAGHAAKLDHFIWSLIGLTQQVHVPFLATLTARDAAGNPFTLFNGTVALSARGSAFSLWSADFEGGLDGFTFDNNVGTSGGLWHRSTGRALDAGHSASNALYFGRNEGATGGGNYDAGIVEGVALAPVINLVSASAPVTLFFQYLIASEAAANFDQATVELSTNNGAAWFPAVGSKSGGLTNDSGGSWLTGRVDLSPWVGRSLRARWRFATIDDQNNAFEGWYVDDVRVLLAVPVPVGPAVVGPFVDGVWTGYVVVDLAAPDVILRVEDAGGRWGESGPLKVFGETPELRIIRTANHAITSWPAATPGFGLEAATSLDPGASWLPVRIAPVLIGNRFVLTNAISGRERYFRLRFQ